MRLDVNAYRDALRLRVAFVASGDVLEESLDIEQPSVQRDAAVFVAGEIQQITPMDISPDGSLIAVTLVRKDRSKQIGLVTGGSGSLRVLKSVDWRGPTRMFFSPNGRDLAYDLPANDTSNQRDVFVLALDGSREVAVVPHPANDAVMGWSPDGKHLLFASDRRGGAMGLWVQAIEGHSPRGTPALVMEGINSAFSPGRHEFWCVVSGEDRGRPGHFRGADRSGDWQANWSTGEACPELHRHESGTGVFTRREALAYVSWRNNNPIFGDPRVLAIRSLDTGETRELRPNLVYFDQVSWAPDGRAFVTGGTDPKGRNGIFRIDARTGDVTPIVQLPLGFERSFPQWSPGGNHIYHRVPLNDDAISEDVAFIERTVVSGAEREVARGAFGAISLSPDGRWIAAQKTDPATKSEALALIPIGGGETRELFRARQPERIVNQLSGIPWTPDSRNVLLRRRSVAGSVELWLVPIADAAARKLDVDVTRWATGNRGLISLSPDGRHIAFLSGQQISEVWVLENFLPAQTPKR